MNSGRWRWAAGLFLSVFASYRLPAQELTATELSTGATALVRSVDAFGGAVGVGRRLSTRQRVVVTGALLRAEGAVTLGRVSLEAHYLVNSAAVRGVALYAGAGLTEEMAQGAQGVAWLTAVLGVEARPGRPVGLTAEIAVGGGLRLTVGMRWRRFPHWWRPAASAGQVPAPTVSGRFTGWQ